MFLSALHTPSDLKNDFLGLLYLKNTNMKSVSKYRVPKLRHNTGIMADKIFLFFCDNS